MKYITALLLLLLTLVCAKLIINQEYITALQPVQPYSTEHINQVPSHTVLAPPVPIACGINGMTMYSDGSYH